MDNFHGKRLTNSINKIAKRHLNLIKHKLVFGGCLTDQEFSFAKLYVSRAMIGEKFIRNLHYFELIKKEEEAKKRLEEELLEVSTDV